MHQANRCSAGVQSDGDEESGRRLGVQERALDVGDEGHRGYEKSVRTLHACSRCAVMAARAAASVVGSESDRRGMPATLTQRRRQCALNPQHESIGRALSRSLWTPRVLRHAPVNAFQEIAELRRRDRDGARRHRGPDEAATLQPLGEQAQALAVVP